MKRGILLKKWHLTLIILSIVMAVTVTGCQKKTVSKLMRCNDRTVTPIDIVTKSNDKELIVYMGGKKIVLEHIKADKSDLYRSQKPIDGEELYLTLALKNNQALWLHETREKFSPPKRELVKTCAL